MLLLCFLITTFSSQAFAQKSVEEVVIHGTPWGGTSGGGSGTSSGGGTALEPSEKDLASLEPRPKLLRKYTRSTLSGRRFLVTEYDANGEWVIKAREVYQEGRQYSSIEISQNFDTWESFAAKANSVTWCREWIETEEKTRGLSSTVSVEGGIPVVKGGAEATASGTTSENKQIRNSKCATHEQ